MSAKFRIQAASKEHWPDIINIYNYYSINSVVNFEDKIHTIKSRLSWFKEIEDNDECHLFICFDEANTVLAYVAASLFSSVSCYRSSLEVSIYCHQGYKGIGLGTMLLEHLLEQLRLSKIHRIYAGITVSNHYSMSLFKKFDFHKVAHFTEVGYKFNQFWDVVWLEKSLTPRST